MSPTWFEFWISRKRFAASLSISEMVRPLRVRFYEGAVKVSSDMRRFVPNFNGAAKKGFTAQSFLTAAQRLSPASRRRLPQKFEPLV